MKLKRGAHVVLLAVALLAGCVSVPSGPSVLVLPGTGKNFDQFRADDFECRQYASSQVGGTNPNEIAGESVAKSAALGTVVGAAAGAAVGGQRGASVGAGTGLAAGTIAGTSAGSSSSYALQQRYDYAFEQCMYAKGHKIPVAGGFESVPSPPRGTYPPPPPPPPPAR